MKRWADGDATRYTAQPAEVSLVDLPCIPDCTFSVIKEDGSSELRKFTSTQDKATAEAIAEKVGVVVDLEEPVAKAEGAAQTEDEYEQVWQSRIDGKTFKKKADMLAHNAELKKAAEPQPEPDPLVAAAQEVLKALDAKETAQEQWSEETIAKFATIWAAESEVTKRDFTAAEREKAAKEGTAMKDGSFPIENKDDLANAIKAYGRAKNKAAAKRHIIRRAKALGATDMLPEDWTKAASSEKAALAESIHKNLNHVAYLVQLLDSLECLEDNYEDMGGDKALSDRFGSLVVEFGDLVAEMLDECLSETKEEEAAEALSLSARVTTLMKVGRRHSKGDQELLQQAHDALSSMGADCKAPEKAASVDDLAKLTSENNALTKSIADTQALLKEIADRVKTIEAQPARPTVPSTLRIVSKGEDNGGSGNEANELGALEKALAGKSPAEAAQYLSTLAIKMSQQQPRRLNVNT